jgi:MerR-like DNA binding protein
MGTARTYHARVAAEAAQVPQLTIRRWHDTDVIKLSGNDSRTTGSGNYYGYSRERIVQLATTGAMLKSGVSLKRAAGYALEFSDSGGNGREAGQLFPVGKTVLVIGNGTATVNNVDFQASVFDLSNGGVAIVVDLNAIVSQVDSVLNNTKEFSR